MERMDVVANATGKILLTLLKKGALYKSQIARESGLSYVHVHRLLPELVSYGLISRRTDNNSHVAYSITDDGKSVISNLGDTSGRDEERVRKLRKIKRLLARKEIAATIVLIDDAIKELEKEATTVERAK